MKGKLTASLIKSTKPKDKAFEIVDTEIKGFLLRVQPTGRMTCYFSYRNEAGKRLRMKIGQLSPALTITQARDTAKIYAGQVESGIDIQTEKQHQRQAVKDAHKNSLRNFIDHQYEPWAHANLKSASATVSMVKSNFTTHLDKPLTNITKQHIERFRTSRLADGIKPSTINRSVNALRGILTKAVEWECLQDHPLSKLKNLVIDNSPKVRYLTAKEDESLLTALEQRDQELKDARARGNQHRQERGYELMPDLHQYVYADRLTPLVILSLKTGMRRGELFDLEWHSVNFETETITVEAANSKSKRTRHIPLSPTALTVLKNWRKQCPHNPRVFPADDGGRLDNVRKSWATVLDNAGISSFRWHDMRHDFASKLVMRGVHLNTVRELCGHAKLETTLRYAHLAPDHKADAIALIG